MENEKNKNIKFAAAGIGLLLASILLKWASAWGGRFADWYGEQVYPLLVRIIGGAAGIIPFSVAEAGLYLLITGCILYGIFYRKRPVRLLSRTIFLVSILFFSYMACCGANYHRTPFSVYAGIERKESSREELEELCIYLTNQVNQWKAEAGKELSIEEYNRLGVEAMEKLADQYPVLGGFYPKPKALMNSRILSVQQLAGIYAPFTIEANYNKDMVPYNIPHTICHELSHLKGFMREDEANFIGYLACIQSEEPEFIYSGYLLGWIYATNALAKENMEGYVSLYRMLDEEIIRDLNANSAFWDQYDGKVAEAADKVNDTYLKMNDQTDGVKSYGRVVDLMLAHYREQKGMEKKS